MTQEARPLTGQIPRCPLAVGCCGSTDTSAEETPTSRGAGRPCSGSSRPAPVISRASDLGRGLPRLRGKRGRRRDPRVGSRQGPWPPKRWARGSPIAGLVTRLAEPPSCLCRVGSGAPALRPRLRGSKLGPRRSECRRSARPLGADKSTNAIVGAAKNAALPSGRRGVHRRLYGDCSPGGDAVAQGCLSACPGDA
jgi:hypothetical protein